jgi:hypothetical protein
MNWITAVLATYGAGLSSWLAYLGWRRDRHRIYFHCGVHRGQDWARLEIVVLNTGHRPVSLSSAHFEQDDGGGYLPVLDESLGLPCKLGEGDTLPMSFDCAELWAGTSAFVVRSYEREHQHVFKPSTRRQWESMPGWPDGVS